VFRSAFFVLVLALAPASVVILAQSSSTGTAARLPPPGAPTETSQPIPAEVAAAEAAIAISDWKTAEAKLSPWLATHPSDARALFDAGYVADAQNRLDDAAALYRRAIDADPKSFEAHLSLGLILARQDKLVEARPELIAATELDPGEAGPALKARAWRALARIDRDSDPAEASNDLLQALKLSPETPDDTLLAAGLAEKTGQNDEAEAAYRRVLSNDPHSAPRGIDVPVQCLVVAPKLHLQLSRVRCGLKNRDPVIGAPRRRVDIQEGVRALIQRACVAA
jgi:tetratricopeptide (TPR) repeat protein